MSYLGFCPPGVIFPYAGSTAPEGWLLCNGQEVSQTIYPSLYAALSFNLTVTTANGSPNVTTATTANIAIGAAVSGTGIQSGSYVVSITNSTTFVLNLNATASGTVNALFKQYDRQTNPTTGSAWTAAGAGNFRVPDYRGIFLRGVGTASALDTTTLGAQQAQKTAKNNLSITAESSSASVTGNKNQFNTNATGTASVTGNKNQFDTNATGTASVTGNKNQFNTNNHRHDIARFFSGGQGAYLVSTALGDGAVDSQKTRTEESGGVVWGNATFTASGTSTTNWTNTFTASGTSTTTWTDTFSAAGTATAQTITITEGTNPETRPINKGVNYIIKI